MPFGCYERKKQSLVLYVKSRLHLTKDLNQREVLEHQQEQSSRKCKATAHSEEVRAKIGKYAVIHDLR